MTRAGPRHRRVRAGRSSIYATGSSPGFITDALPFALLSLQRRVDSIEIDEFANLSQRDSPHMLFEQMGFGRPSTTSTRTGRRTSWGSSHRRSPSSPTRRAGRSTSGPARVRSPRRGRRRRRWASSRPGRSRRSGPPSWGAATAPRSCGSPRTGTARPTSSRRGTCARRDGGCGCTATCRSMSGSSSRSRSRTWDRSRPGTPRTGR